MSKNEKLSLGQLEVKSFTTDLKANSDARKGGCTFGNCTNLYNCDTGNPYCELFPNNTQPVNCTGCCSFIC